MAQNQIIDTDSEDELPSGWEERVTVDGKVYYANHESSKTQWFHPVTHKKKRIAGELPYGWEMNVNEAGHVYFVDHVNKKTTYTDPRLAFAVEDKDKFEPHEVRQRYDGGSTGLQILMGRDLTGKYAIVTGGNSGIGFETARSLSMHGCHVVIACRNMKTANAAAKRIKVERTMAAVEVMTLDLASFRSIKQMAENYCNRGWPLQILVLNAGVFSMPYTMTEDGYEATFQINHLGHMYLTQLLQHLLVQSASSRVVAVSAESHRFSDLKLQNLSPEKLSPGYHDYTAIYAYNQSKLCNILLTRQLHHMLYSSGVKCNAVHPGNVVGTSITRNWWVWKLIFLFARPFTKSRQQAAATSVYCATARELEDIGGMYYNNCFQCCPSEVAADDKMAARLWDICDQMIKRVVGFTVPR